jgi:predicted nucleic acid-binding protein
MVGQELQKRGLGRYERSRDKEWGFVDCVSFEVMEENVIYDAFTNDRHFEQAGFRCLLK